MHDMNGKRKREVSDLNRQLEDMKKMAEDTAARLKEATVYQQGPPKPVSHNYREIVLLTLISYAVSGRRHENG
jgi:hypothetical protein